MSRKKRYIDIDLNPEDQRKAEVAYGPINGVIYEKIRAKTQGQQKYIDCIHDNIITLCDGEYGTGKTTLATALGIEYLREGKVEQLVISRPAVSACGEEQGYYPGGYAEKLEPFLIPVLDSMHQFAGANEIKEWINQKKIKMMPTSLLRGQNWNHTFTIIDECSNLTFEQLLLILTRVGKHSKLVLSGTTKVSDLPRHKQGAFEDFFDILQNIDGIGFAYLGVEDIIRSPLIAKIMKNVEEFRTKVEKVPKYF